MTGHSDRNVGHLHPLNGMASYHGRDKCELPDIRIVNCQEEGLIGKIP